MYFRYETNVHLYISSGAESVNRLIPKMCIKSRTFDS